ncbi:MAG: hypothetical protein ACRCUP_07180 [Mycoplasmatales bacterium]
MKLLKKTNYKRKVKTALWKSTTGTTPNAVKRKVKKKINPLYGTTTSGWLKPKKKIYNKVYKKSSFNLLDIFIKLIEKSGKR